MAEPVQYSDIEMMVIAASREIKDHQFIFTGTFWPLLAASHAKKYHAKNIFTLFEGGVMLDTAPFRIPLLTSDISVMLEPIMLGDCFDTLGMLLHGGRDQLCMLSAANVDKYGNINTTCVGDYNDPDFRLAGSGGAADFGVFSNNLVILIEHDKLRFQGRVEYITSPGYLTGGKSREQAGMAPGTGPKALISTMGVFRFHSETKEMYLESYFRGKSVDLIKENVQWNLKIAEDVYEFPSPCEEELRVLREEVDPAGMFLRGERERSDW